jgi:DNA polymerase
MTPGKLDGSDAAKLRITRMPKRVTLDLETYYDREYSLSKITTEEYVRSPLFETIGFAIKVNDGPTEWVPQPAVGSFLAEFDWSDALVVCQNTQFDGAILSWRYGVNPLAWLDTLGMSRALYPHEKSHSLKSQAARMGVGVKGDEVLNALGKRYADFSPEELARYAEYCRNDVDLTYALFLQYMAAGFPKQEMKLIDMTLRLYTEPVLELDAGVLSSHLAGVKARKRELLDAVQAQMPGSDGEDIKKHLMSNERFAELLRANDVEPPMKVSPTTGKPAYAFAKTDEEFTALEEHPDEAVQVLVAARLGNKSTIEETRTERFIGMAGRGKFPVPLRYYGAHPGRWSGEQAVNMQNLPTRGPSAGKIQKAIKAPPGYVVIDCDSSQIEARCLAWMAGQDDLVDAFRNKQDIYKLMASRIYGIAPEEVTEGAGSQRQVGKTVVLGAGFGVGHMKLRAFLRQQAKVDVSEAEAKRIIDTYRATYPRIPELWRRAGAALSALALGQTMRVDIPGIINAVPGRGLTLPSGLSVQYPDLKRMADEKTGKVNWRYTSKGAPVYIYGGKCVENFTQGVARCVVAEQALRIAKRYKVVLLVHDAVACIAPEAEAEQAQAYVEQCMRWVPKWATGLPLACESGMGATYGDC